ncbi:MAG: polymerase subunit epsilon [Rhodoferax sp.]|nr:polymerase subunit epsilon [Rhodoferax sp.]
MFCRDNQWFDGQIQTTDDFQWQGTGRNDGARMMQQLGFGFEEGVPALAPVAHKPARAARKSAAEMPPPVAQQRAMMQPLSLLDGHAGPASPHDLTRSTVDDSAVPPPSGAPVGQSEMVVGAVVNPVVNAVEDAVQDAVGAELALQLPVALVVAETDSGAQPGLEALAQQLETHPDYRVLRRLVPRLHYGARVTEAARAVYKADRADNEASDGVARLLILDTETTGLSHARDKIMELALLRVDVDRATGQPVGPVLVYDGLEDPGQPIPAEVRAITGIDDDMVRGQRLDTDRIAELLDGVDLIVAHNAGFDRPFVEARLPAFAARAWACSFADIDWKGEGRGSAKLESLALGLGLFYDAHRAEMDCHALLAVLQADLPAARVTGLARLLSVAPTLRYRLQANGAPFDAKDQLKDRGYRWDATQKVWHTRIDDAAGLATETAWLKDQVYGGRPARVQVETLDARVRYSARAGLMDWYAL